MTTQLLFELAVHSDLDRISPPIQLIGRFAADHAGFSAADQQKLGEDVVAVYRFLLENSVWHHEKPAVTLALMKTADGLVAQFSDMAHPWREDQLKRDLSADIFGEQGGNLAEFDCAVEAFNRGLTGRTLRLSIPLVITHQPNEPAAVAPIETEFTYRLLAPHEGHEMVSGMYTAYGYTYGIPDVYSADETGEMIANGRMAILGAQAADGKIAAVSALRKRVSASTVYDLCQTAVKPGYLGKQIFGNLLKGVVELARTPLKAQGISGTIPNRHHVSQKMLQRVEFVPTGILLGIVPAEFLPKQIGPFNQERESFLLIYKSLRDPDFGPLYTPPHHRVILNHLCKTIGFENPIFSIEPALAHSGFAKINSRSVDNMKTAAIEVHKAGVDLVDQVFAYLSDFKSRHFGCIQLLLDLSDPVIMGHCARFEAMGFFFAGFLPDERPWLVLQYLNNVPVLFDELDYSYPGAKYIQYHIEQMYRLVRLRQKGEFGRAEQMLNRPNFGDGTAPVDDDFNPLNPTSGPTGD